MDRLLDKQGEQLLGGLLTFLWQCFPGHPVAGKELELSRWAFGVHGDPFVQEQELRIARKVSSARQELQVALVDQRENFP